MDIPWPYSWAIIALSKSPSIWGPTVTPLMVPLIVPINNSSIIASPTILSTINNGIVTWSPTAPPAIVIASPSTLLTIITATAPSFWAANDLKPNSHSPLLITAIFPFKSPPLVIGSQASFGSSVPLTSSSTNTKSSVKSTISPPKAAGIPS